MRYFCYAFIGIAILQTILHPANAQGEEYYPHPSPTYGGHPSPEYGAPPRTNLGNFVHHGGEAAKAIYNGATGAATATGGVLGNMFSALISPFHSLTSVFTATLPLDAQHPQSQHPQSQHPQSQHPPFQQNAYGHSDPQYTGTTHQAQGYHPPPQQSAYGRSDSQYTGIPHLDQVQPQAQAPAQGYHPLPQQNAYGHSDPQYPGPPHQAQVQPQAQAQAQGYHPPPPQPAYGAPPAPGHPWQYYGTQ